MFKHRKIETGSGPVDRWTLFEFKRLFSVYVHRWNVDYQDRYHTHAFDAWSWMVRGSYKERLYVDDNTYMEHDVTPGFRFIPWFTNHSIANCRPNTWTVTFAGPWRKTWTETKHGIITVFGWGRKRVWSVTLPR